MCFLNKLYLRCGKMCLICSKTKFITNIINVTGIHTFSFYKRHTFTTTNITFITKHTQFTKINIDPVTGPKLEILRSCGGTVPPKVLKLYFFCVFFNKMCIICCKICVVYSKVKFITNIINVTRIHIFYFQTCLSLQTQFTTKHKHFIKTHIGPVAEPKCVPNNNWYRRKA